MLDKKRFNCKARLIAIEQINQHNLTLWRHKLASQQQKGYYYSSKNHINYFSTKKNQILVFWPRITKCMHEKLHHPPKSEIGKNNRIKQALFHLAIQSPRSHYRTKSTRKRDRSLKIKSKSKGDRRGNTIDQTR